LLALTKGDMAVCGTDANNNAVANDPAKAEEWGTERHVRAAVVRWLCVDKRAREFVDPMGVQVYGAMIVGTLDLSYAIVPFPVLFWHCRFRDDLDLTAGQFNELDLQGTWVRSIGAERIEVRHSVFLRNGFLADREVRFLGGQIGGDFDCGHGTFKNPLRSGVPETGRALTADRVIVKGVVFLNDSFLADGEVRLIDAEIGAKLDCSSGTFKNPVQPTGGGVALNMDRVTVKAGVFLTGGFSAEGEVRLLGARVGGDLVCNGGIFRNHAPSGVSSDGDALSADGINVTSNVLLNKTCIEGNVRFWDARVGGVFTCTGGDFEVFNLRRAAIKDAFFWTNIHGSPNLVLDLTNTSVGALFDDPQSWPSQGNLFLNGFVYERISAGPTDAVSRINWLARQKVQEPQPFRRLAQVLKELGDEDGARRVLVEMERRRRAEEWSSPILRLTTGYGYHPLWALWWLGGLSLLGWIIFRRGQLAKTITPTDEVAYQSQETHGHPPPHYPRFSPMIYSLENSLPLVKLGQADRWQPDPNSRTTVLPLEKWLSDLIHRSRSWVVPTGLQWIRAFVELCLKGMSYISRATRSPVFLRWFLWAQILLGWILATLFAAGITGIVQK